MSEHPNRLTIGQAKERLRVLEHFSCYIIDDSETDRKGQYWKARSEGYADNIAEAGIYTVGYVCRELDYVRCIIELIAPIPAPAPERILLTKAQVSSNLAVIEDKMALWVDPRTKTYARKPFGTGLVTSEDEAQRFTAKTLAEREGHFLIYLIDQEEALRISKIPYRKCSMERALPKSLIDGLRIVPGNPTHPYWGQILQITGLMPPDTIKTFEELKEWVEWNVEAGNKVTGPDNNRTWEAGPEVIAARLDPVPAPPTPTLTFNLQYSEMEVGSCRYRVLRSGDNDFQVDREEVLEIVQDSTELAEVVERIERLVGDHAWDNGPEMDHYGDYDYDNHETGDSDDAEWEFNQPSVVRRNLVKDYLRSILPQEELTRLGIFPDEVQVQEQEEEENEEAAF